MKSRKLRNKLGLNISSTANTSNSCENTVDDDLNKKIQELDCTGSRKEKLDKFITERTKIGELHKEDFDKISDLGFGSGGSVIKVVHKQTGIIMALKLIHLEVKPAIRNQILRELKVLHQCNSPYIVGFYGTFYVSSEISICMELMEPGSLDKILIKAKFVPEYIISKIVNSVLLGLNYLHEKHNVIHRDVKPSNILLNYAGEVKICDFGVSGQLIDSMANSFVGTRSYMAPERLQGIRYSVKSDLWSLGLSIVELAIGIYPIPPPPENEFKMLMTKRRQLLNISVQNPIIEVKETEVPATNSKPMAIFELLDYIVNEKPPLISSEFFTPELSSFVDLCLKKNPEDRADILVLMKHDFIVNVSHSDTAISDWLSIYYKNDNNKDS